MQIKKKVVDCKRIEVTGDPQHATIYFEDGKFKECKFTTACNIYIKEDWEFLYEVAKIILGKEKEKK